jgi:AraC family transcriptional activator of tynA and feaB
MTRTELAGTFQVGGPVSLERIEAWSKAYVSSRIADAVWLPEQLTSFRGRLRRRTLQDLVLVDIEADPFVARWSSDSIAAEFIGVSVNKLRFAERVVLGNKREFVTTSSIGIWDSAGLLESEPLERHAQTVLLVPKAALHMSRNCSLPVSEDFTDQDRAALRLLRSLILAVAVDAERLGSSAAAAARSAVVEMLLSVVQNRRQTAGGAVSESMRMSVSRWVDENLPLGQLSPAQAAQEHGISVRSLHRLFADSGDSFGSLVRRRRLERASRDLLRTDDMVQTVAMRWGYADASQFINEFKREHDVTPAVYRKAHRAAA